MLYRKNYEQEGVHFVTKRYYESFSLAKIYLGIVFSIFFKKENGMPLKEKNWMKEVQEKVTKNFSAGLEKETKQTAFISSLKNILKKRQEQKSN